MSTAEKKKLRQIVEKVHRAGRRVRFWSTPENTAVRNELYDAGVDLINTDDLDALQRFLLRKARQGDQQLRGSQAEANSRCVELFSGLLPRTFRISRTKANCPQDSWRGTPPLRPGSGLRSARAVPEPLRRQCWRTGPIAQDRRFLAGE